MFEIDKVITSVAVISGILATWYGLSRSAKSDKISEQSGIASDKTAGVAQNIEAMRVHIDGLNTFIAALQADKKVDREDIRILTEQRDALQRELNRMYRKYGEDDDNSNQGGT